MLKTLPTLLLGLLLGAGSAWAVGKAVARPDRSRDDRPSAPAQPDAGPTRAFRDDADGFTIEVPRFPDSKPNQPSIAAQFSGTPAEGYASTVQVAIQGASTTRSAYRDLSLGQFRDQGMRVIAVEDRTVSGREAVAFEYEGTARGRLLHFLALAVPDGDRVVLVTCSATPEAFPAAEPGFRACLAGFTLRDAR